MPGHDGQQGFDPMRWLLTFILAGLLFASAARADDAIKLCTAGHMTFGGTFAEHIAFIKKANRYDKKEIEDLIKQQKSGGLDFFSTQIVIKSEQSGSGDFDLHMYQGHSDPKTTYKADQDWACTGDDYPVAYFIGFKVETIGGSTISVSRSKGLVNVISLKKIDPELKTPTRVEDSVSHAILCKDIATGCVPQIFYGSY
jgi:hypothetical protein